jgi:hypothetical protein
VIRIDLDNVTKKDSAILLKSFNNCKEFQLDNCVASLSVGKFATVECQGSSVLLNYGSNLFVRCIRVDFKWNSEVGISKDHLFCE